MRESNQAVTPRKYSRRVRAYFVLIILYLLYLGYDHVIQPGLVPCEWLDRALNRSGCFQVVTAHDIVHGIGYNIGFGFSETGNLLISGVYLNVRDDEGGEQLRISAELWTVAGNQLSPYLDWTIEPAWAIVLSPDGTRAAVATENGVDLWESPHNMRWSAHRLADVRASQLAFSPDGSLLAVGSGTMVKIWRVSDGALLHTVPVELNKYMGGLSFSPDGTILAVGGGNGVSLWRVADMALVRQFAKVGSLVTFSNDGTTLAAAVDSTDIWLWRVSDGVLLNKLEGHPNTVGTIAISPDNRVLASATGAEMRWWRLPSGEPLAVIKAPVDTVAFTPQGNTLAVKMDNNNISLWHIPEK